ncbi:MAG: SDR family oxidoreductase [Myxococcales bacterium]|nr:MAG: SDR family oxidoreductase [Myxococcales bacterium]
MGTLLRSVLVTGFPSRQPAVHLVRELAADDERTVCCLVTEGRQDRALELLDALPASARERVSLWVGDPRFMDLGLSGEEFAVLAEGVEIIHHCASVTDPAGTKEEAAGNLRAAAEILELAEAAPRLKRLVFWSSATVSGNREGFVKETELDDQMGFRNPIEESLYRVERMLHESAEELPIVVLRPALMVGDSATGEVEDLNGLYLLIRFLLSAPEDYRIPTPSRTGVRISAVPVDYAVKAGVRISADEQSIGRTFHIVDPKPVTVQYALRLFAEATGRPAPRDHDPLNLATALMRAPGLQRFTNTTRAFLDHLKTDVIYDDRNTRELLAGTGIQCPALESYVEVMVARAQQD